MSLRSDLKQVFDVLHTRGNNYNASVASDKFTFCIDHISQKCLSLNEHSSI